MALRASETVWWPGLSVDLARVRELCGKCKLVAPSQPAAPPKPVPLPDYPFQMLSSDYFDHGGQSYLVAVDRYSGWPVVVKMRNDSSEELIRVMRGLFCCYGVPEEIATDGAPVYVSTATEKFLGVWGVRHRVSSAYFPHSNLRAETAVKSMKRLIMANTGSGGTLDTDKFAAAMLMYRNTPDRDTGLSPAQVLYARQLRDTIPCKPENLKLRPEWVLTREAREKALARRHQIRGSDWADKTKVLNVLKVGQVVQVQNQRGPHSNKWDLSGVIVEVQEHDAYLVRMDGSGRVSKRNRRFLKPIRSYKEIMAGSRVVGNDQTRGLVDPSSRENGSYSVIPTANYYVPGRTQTTTTSTKCSPTTMCQPTSTKCSPTTDCQPATSDVSSGQSEIRATAVHPAVHPAVHVADKSAETDVTSVRPSHQLRDCQRVANGGQSGNVLETNSTTGQGIQFTGGPRNIERLGEDDFLASNATPENSTRPRRVRKQPDRYQAGDPTDRAFNRRKGHG